jgi:hypothetical protein
MAVVHSELVGGANLSCWHVQVAWFVSLTALGGWTRDFCL